MGLLTRDPLGPLTITVAIFLLLVDLRHWRQCWAPRYPSDPMPLPGLGNLLQVDLQDTPLTIDLQLRHRFGNVFRLQLAWMLEVVLNRLAAMCDTLVYLSKDLPTALWFPHLSCLNREAGRIASEWSVQGVEEGAYTKAGAGGVRVPQRTGLYRKEVDLHPMPLPGLGNLLQVDFLDLCCCFTRVKKVGGCPFRPNTLLNKAVRKVISSLTYGCHFNYNNPRSLKLWD
nr:PREDICTED: cytochrome P450 2D14-like [Equus przewalskii]